jgi:hypothetical protein
MIMKPSSLLLLPGCGFLLLQQQVHGLVPLLSSHRSIISNNNPPSYAAQRRHPLLRDDRQEGVATASAFAFASTSSSRLFFTPKVVATGDGDGDGDDDGPLFIRPAPHNSSLFRSVSILCALLFAMYQGCSSSAAAPAGAASANGALRRFAGKYYPVLPPHAAASVHLLSFSIWFGTVVHTTFVAGITMFKNLPRRVFGTLQSKLFPLYFRLCSGMIGVQVRELGYIAIVRSHSKFISRGCPESVNFFIAH